MYRLGPISRLKGQSDAFFVFACIAVGLAAGTRTIGIALVLAVFFTFMILAVSPRQHDPESQYLVLKTT
jgi:NADH:ubiquinone oxidoreductase subunit K